MLCYVMCTCVNDRVYSRLHGPYTAVDTARVYIAHTRPCSRHVHVHYCLHGRLHTRPVYTAVFKSYHIAACFSNVKITFFSLFTSRAVPQGMCSRFSSVHHVHYSPDSRPAKTLKKTFDGIFCYKLATRLESISMVQSLR